MLLEAGGASVSKVDSSGRSALHFAAQYNNVELAQTLLRWKIAVNAKRWSDGCTPVHVAVSNGALLVLDLLIHEGKADLSIPDNNLCLPLHHAAEANQRLATDLLLAHGSPMNSKNITGSTALHLAMENRNREVIDVLVKYKVGDFLFSSLSLRKERQEKLALSIRYHAAPRKILQCEN